MSNGNPLDFFYAPLQSFMGAAAEQRAADPSIATEADQVISKYNLDPKSRQLLETTIHLRNQITAEEPGKAKKMAEAVIYFIDDLTEKAGIAERVGKKFGQAMHDLFSGIYNLTEKAQEAQQTLSDLEKKAGTAFESVKAATIDPKYAHEAAYSLTFIVSGLSDRNEPNPEFVAKFKNMGQAALFQYRAPMGKVNPAVLKSPANNLYPGAEFTTMEEIAFNIVMDEVSQYDGNGDVLDHLNHTPIRNGLTQKVCIEYQKTDEYQGMNED